MQMQVIIDRFIRHEKSHSYQLSAIDRLLLIILASYMGKKDSCWPSYLLLAKDCNLSSRTIIRTVKKLEKNKLIYVFRAKDMNNIYTFNLEKLSTSSDTESLGSDTESYGVVTQSHTNNISNNINNKKVIFKKLDQKQTAKFWGPGNSDYDRVHG